MFRGDELNLKAVRELAATAQSSRPIVIWIGAGASANAGLPSWWILAERIHSEYKAMQSGYDSAQFSKSVDCGDFPGFFEYCRTTNSHRYNNLLVRNFTSIKIGDVYLRMCSQLKAIRPLRIVTTNADELLETHVGCSNIIQNSDIERVTSLLATHDEFLCKLHGSISAIASLVFTSSEYAKVTADQSFVHAIQTLFSSTTVVFLGCSLQDEYVLRLLTRQISASKLFGAGPHFLIASARNDDLPTDVRQIVYEADEVVGHRAFLTTLDVLIRSSASIPAQQSQNSLSSKFYLPDFMDTGTWQSSQSFAFADASGNSAGQAYVGTGFINAELQSVRPLGLHNLVVGLVCYDKIVLPLDSIGNFHRVVGPDRFMTLVRSEAIEFAWVHSQAAVVFGQQDLVANGGLVALTIMSQDLPGAEESFESALSRQIAIISKNPTDAEKTLNEIRAICVEVSPDLTNRAMLEARGALILPNVRAALGIGDGILPTHIPKWFVFPVLRVAHLMRDAAVAQHFGAAATQLPFGTFSLAQEAFSMQMQMQSQQAADIASYVVAGQYEVNLGLLLQTQPDLFNSLLSFRATQQGVDTRAEILTCTATSPGSELSAAVEGALARAFNTKKLQIAMNKFATLCAATGRVSLWTSQQNSAMDFGLWRRRSAGILREVLGTTEPDGYMRCPCGSGDKLKFCCGSLLREFKR